MCDDPSTEEDKEGDRFLFGCCWPVWFGNIKVLIDLIQFILEGQLEYQKILYLIFSPVLLCFFLMHPTTVALLSVALLLLRVMQL